MTNMVEKVARAMFNATPFRDAEGPYEAQSDVYRRFSCVLARAAVEAMREPTDEMMAAVGKTSLQGRIWNLMIDAALSNTKEGGE